MMVTMRAIPRPRRAGWKPGLAFLLLLAALGPVGGCDCTRTNPVAPTPLPPLSAVVVTPASDTLRVGEDDQLVAVALDTLGAPVAGAGFTWTSGDPSVVSVSAAGRITGVGDGLAFVYAEAGGKVDSAAIFVYADSGWVMQPSHTARNLNGVFFRPDGREGWAVGDGGTIMHTLDAGTTWAAQVSRTTANLNGVTFVHPDSGWAVGNGGTILVSGDGGANWTRLTVGFGENLNDVTFANPDTGFAVGSAGAVARTVDGGQTWQKQNLSGFAFRSVSFSSPREGWLVGDGGEIWGTVDAGTTWQHVQPSITSSSLRGVWRRSTTQAWAVGAQGLAPFTIASGPDVVWVNSNAGAFNNLQGVSFPPGQIGYAVGFSGTGVVLRSDNAGLDWTRQVSNTSAQLNDVYFVDPLRGWAVGDGGAIIHTALGGLR
jgi:photosystem II stability/assembly factor-like uncharacterized protein